MNEDEVVKQILQSAGKHPNSRVSKLIHGVLEEQSQKNIVLLLIELAEHSEYATDFNISLRYYLDLFNKLDTGVDIVLNEAGLLLLNASKIYAKRVDYVHELVERQILTISSADNEVEKGKTENSENTPSSPTSKGKRARKRLVEEPNDPFAIEMVPKKFRKLTDEKRFSINKPNVKTKTMEQVLPNMDTETFTHPACWLHSRILDFDNEENVDTQRNYKLFTYHVEHRYNTLVPDINFRLHFKVKDYLDQEEDDRLLDELKDGQDASIQSASQHIEVWPPLSAAYVRKYLRLENHVLDQECSLPKRKRLNTNDDGVNCADSALNKRRSSRLSEDNRSIDLNQTALDKVQNSEINHSNSLADSALGDSLQNNSTNNLENSNISDDNTDKINISDSSNTTIDTSTLGNTSSEHIPPSNDSGFSESMAESNTQASDSSMDESKENAKSDSSMDESKENAEKFKAEHESGNENKNEIRVHLPHLDDEGVFFSELNEQDVRMLSPTVVATDVFPLIPNKENLTIIVDDEIKAFLNVDDDDLDDDKHFKAKSVPIVLNIMQINEKLLRRRVQFRLGPEFDIYKQARMIKRTRTKEVPEIRYGKLIKYYSLKDTDMTGIPMTPPPSPGNSSDEDFLGFSDVEEDDSAENTNVALNKESRLSRDSGVGTDMHITTNASNLDSISEEFASKEHVNKTDNSNEANNTTKESASGETNSEDPITSRISQDTGIAIDNEADQPSSEDDVEAEPIQRQSEVLNDLFSELEANSSKTKIQKWHEHLQPILAKSRERHHFDVFQLGTEIIQKFDDPSPLPPSTSPDRQKTFEDVMEDNEPSYVSRYFLSTLLLANQGNLKINVQNKSTEEPSAWSDVHLELVNTNRHTVAIEDNIGIISTKNATSNGNQAHKKPATPSHHTPIAEKVQPASAAAVVKRNKLKLNVATSTPTHGLLTPPATPLSAAGTPIPYNVNTNDKPVNLLTSKSSHNILNVNLSTVRPLKPVEKVPHANDDDDSGIFSREEVAS